MSSLPRPWYSLALALALLTGLQAVASDSIDLKRETPVPADQPIPVADFFRYPAVQAPDINRTGTQIAALYSAKKDWVDLMVYTIATTKYKYLSAPAERNVTDFTWLDHDHLICTFSNPQAIVGVDSRYLSQPYPILQISTAVPVSAPDRHRLKPLIWVHYNFFYQNRDDGVSVVDSQLVKGELVGYLGQMTGAQFNRVRDDNQAHILKTYPVPGGGFQVAYITDKDGELAFAITMKDGVSTLHRLVGDHWETCPIDLDKVDVISCGDKPGQLVVLGPRGTGQPRPLEFMDAATGKPGEVLLKLKGRDFIGRLYREPVHHLIIGAHYTTVGPQSAWFLKAYTGLQKMLTNDPHLKGLAVRILGSGVPQRRFLVEAFSDRQPAKYYVLDLKKRSLNPIMNARPWIDPARMRPMITMQYHSRYGRRFDAYVTLPRGVSKQHPAPLVVLVHDGSVGRVSWGFNSEVQFLASRGYAVLEPNYRGDAGYGWQFTPKEEWNFRRMSDDITDATKALLTTGYVDPKRVAIMGSEFQGGYLALSGAVFNPDLYRCCIVNNGLYDWADVLSDQKYFKYDSPFYSGALRFLGNPSKAPEKFKAMSPLRHVNQIKAATFVDYLRADPLETTQAHRLTDALQKAGVPHEELAVGDTFAGRNHLKDLVDIYSHIATFLDKNLKPAP